jgi:hypothetical protein
VTLATREAQCSNPNSRAALDATGAAVSLGVDAVLDSPLAAGGVVEEDVVAAGVVEEGS